MGAGVRVIFKARSRGETLRGHTHVLALLGILGLAPFPDDYFPGLLRQITDELLTRQTARLSGGFTVILD